MYRSKQKTRANPVMSNFTFQPSVIISQLSRSDYRQARILRTSLVPKSDGPEEFSVYRKVGQNILPGQCLGVSRQELAALIREDALKYILDDTYGESWVLTHD